MTKRRFIVVVVDGPWLRVEAHRGRRGPKLATEVTKYRNDHRGRQLVSNEVWEFTVV